MNRFCAHLFRDVRIFSKRIRSFIAAAMKKKCLSVNETAAYTGIGRGKIRELMKVKGCNFVTTDGYQQYVIIDKFVEFITNRQEI